MPSWGEILKEANKSAAERGPQLGPDLDGIRLKYAQALHNVSGNAVIVYASGWLHSGGRVDLDHSVVGGDVHAFMEVCHGVEDRQLDLILHSPGGSPEAAEQLVNYLRTQFDYVRAIVPIQAKSAATMIALGCDEIVLGKHSELGPIDPQILIPVPGGQRAAPAHAILRDFDRAKSDIAANVGALAAWTPILHAYSGGLLEFCHQQIKLSQEIIASWLQRYMLAHEDADVPDAERQSVATEIADYFGSAASYDRFRTHGRPIRVEELEQIHGLRIRRLESDKALQDAVLSLYHALDITLDGPAVKVVENHLGGRWVRSNRTIVLQQQSDQNPPGQAPGVPAPRVDRAERRRQEREAQRRR